MTKNIKQFDLTFFCEGGKYKLNECKKWPTKKQIEETIENLDGVGAGTIKEIVINNIKF